MINVEGEINEKGFKKFTKRLQAKCLLLTYFCRNPNLDEQTQRNVLNPELIKQELWKKNSEIVEYLVVGQEVCPDTKRLHCHVLIAGRDGGRFRFTTDEKFYFSELTNPNIRIVTPSTIHRVIRYCKKDGNWVEIGELPDEKPKKKRVFAEALTKLSDMNMTNQQRIDSAMDVIFHGDPESWSKDGVRIRKNYELFVGREIHPNNYSLQSSIERLCAKYTLFRERYHLRILQELQNPMGRSIVIRGPSGCGKTQYACGLLGHSNICNKLESLRGHDMARGLIFDDFKIAYSEAESWIHLFDREQTRQIRILYGVIEIPRGTRKIFTSNRRRLLGDDESALCKCATEEHAEAITRRVLDVDLWEGIPEQQPKKKIKNNSLWLQDH